MSGPDWKQLWQIFHEVSEAPEEERSGLLDELCDDDDVALRVEVESLLEASADPVSLLGDERGEGTGASTLAVGQHLGPWRIVRRIGEGGMGEVYEAVRDEDGVRQRAAVKLLLPGLDSGRLAELFLRERRILSRLDHPHVARFLDAGTEGGRPYLVMEFVDGVPLTRYCQERDLGLVERLRLFCSVCDAVSFAHRNLVVHRDLKPGNILVTEDGVPKLLDFGIAKLLEGESTRTVTRLMTPSYASPEQLRGEPVTTASDVYALGVVLYELLTDRSPYRVSTDAPFDLAREVMERTPDRPSLVVRTGTAEAGAILPGRGTTGPRHSRRLRGDLDTIVLTALHKDPERRYANAEQLAGDVRRHLDGLPILARADSVAYRLSKFVRRHPLAVASMLVAVIALLTATTVTTLQSRRLEVALSTAEEERAVAENVAQFLVDLLQQPDPMRARGEQLTVDDLLDNASAAANDRLRDQPEVRRRLLNILSRVQMNRGDLSEAASLQEEAVALAREAGDPLLLGTYLRQLGKTVFELGENERAMTLAEESLVVHRGLPDPPELEVADTLGLLGVLYREAGDLEGASAIHREAIGLLEAGGGTSEKLGEAWNFLGIAVSRSGDVSGAEEAYRRAVDLLRASVGEKHPTTISATGNLAGEVHAQGDLMRAREMLQRSVQIRREVFGDAHPTTVVGVYNLGKLLHDLGEHDAAARALADAVGGARAAWGDRHPVLATMLARQGSLLTDAGRLGEARAVLEESRAIRREALPEGHHQIAETLLALAELRAAEGEREEAGRLFARGLEGYRASLGEEHPQVALALLRHARFLLAAGGREGAERALAELEESVDVLEGDGETNRRRLALVAGARGEALVRLGRLAEARPLLESSLRELASPRTPETERAEERLARLERAERGAGEPAR